VDVSDATTVGALMERLADMDPETVVWVQGGAGESV
jgi:UDP-N-acetylmuramoylalanine-D-glutamate ligase